MSFSSVQFSCSVVSDSLLKRDPQSSPKIDRIPQKQVMVCPLKFMRIYFLAKKNVPPSTPPHTCSYTYFICLMSLFSGDIKISVKSENVSRSVMSSSLRPHGLQPARLLCPWNSPGKNTGVGCHFLLQGIFLTWGSNPGLLHCRQILYQLSHKGSPY